MTKQDLIKEIKRQFRNYKKGLNEENEQIRNLKLKMFSPNFLGFVENKDLNDNVESYFITYINGCCFYDWVNGNNKLKELVKEVII